jgi:hypothetical protein
MIIIHNFSLSLSLLKKLQFSKQNQNTGVRKINVSYTVAKRGLCMSLPDGHHDGDCKTEVPGPQKFITHKGPSHFAGLLIN